MRNNIQSKWIVILKSVIKFGLITMWLSMAGTAFASDNLYTITEKFITAKGQTPSWHWQAIADLPKSKHDNEYLTFDDNNHIYYLQRTIGEPTSDIQNTLTGYGNATAPHTLVLQSTLWQQIGFDENDERLQLSQIVNTNNLTMLKSNCNLSKISKVHASRDHGDDYDQFSIIDFQKIYKWSRPQSEPLYITEVDATGVLITSTYQSQSHKTYIITQSKSQMEDAIAKYGSAINSKGKDIACRIS